MRQVSARITLWFSSPLRATLAGRYELGLHWDAVGRDPAHEGSAVHRSVRDTEDHPLGIGEVGLGLEAIEHQESFDRGVAGALVPVDKWMIANEAEAECRSLLVESGLQVLTAISHSRLRHR